MINSWLVRGLRTLASVYLWVGAVLVAIGLIAAVTQLGIVNDPPTRYWVHVGPQHPPLAAGVSLQGGPGSGTAISQDSPVLGSLIRNIHTGLQLFSPLVITLLAIRALDAARGGGPFAEAVPGRLAMLGWALIVGNPLVALGAGLCTGYLHSHLFAATTFGDAGLTAFLDAVSWPAIASGIAVIVLRSIIVEGVDMRRDIDATV